MTTREPDFSERLIGRVLEHRSGEPTAAWAGLWPGLKEHQEGENTVEYQLTGGAGELARQHMRRVIAQLGDPRRQADMIDPEAGA